ncbi:MAG: efflux RND transporter periplasmic adaptor subunit, partial [Candidatus Levyibacteriota bacterium]
ADLTFPVSGTLAYIGVRKGDYVQRFQTIATLDERTVQKNLQQALITYSEQRNTFDQTNDNYNHQTPSGALTDAIKRILQNNQYDLDKSVNSVELQDLVRQQAILASPIAGIVTRADATTPGITAGITGPTFSIVDPSSIAFDMDVDEADIGKVTVGQNVNVSLDAYPDETLHMQVSKIDFNSHTTSNGGNAFTVEVGLQQSANGNYKYRVGMNGNADITVAQKENVLIIPIVSLVDDGASVYVQNGKKFMKKKVTTGLESDTEVEITGGLQENDIVVLEPSRIPAK